MKKETIISFLCGAVITMGIAHINYKSEKKKDLKTDKFYQIYENWLILKQRGKGVDEYFYKNGYREIAIYGYGKLGKSLLMDLKNTNLKVKYIIDKRKINPIADIQVYKPGDMLPIADVIVITPVMEYNEIKKELRKSFFEEIVSIEDVLYECI